MPTPDPERSSASLRRNRAHAAPRGRWVSAFSVALATVGCAPPGPAAPQAAVEALRESIDVGPPLNTTISLLRSGVRGAAMLILVHGTPGSASAWTDYLLDPPPGMEVLALDRPGFGQSGPPGAVTSLAAQAAAVVALLPTDGRKVVLLGHSLGAPIVALVAALHPQQVSGIVLLAGSLDPAQEQTLMIQHLGALWPIRAMLPRAIRNTNAELMALEPELQALQPLLPRIGAKVVIVHGSKDDLVPVENVAFVQAHLGGARCVRTVLLEGQNHFLPWNSAAVVRQSVQTALADGCLNDGG